MGYPTPWSKRHKLINRDTEYNLSNSFAEPLSHIELVELSLARGDQKIVDEFHDHSLEYTPAGGSLDLKQDIANLYGDNIEAKNIVVFAGGQVALQTAAIALLSEDDHAIVFTPGYQSVQQTPEHAGSQVTRIQLHPKDNWQINLSLVEAAIKHNTKYIIINEPFNPAGTLMGHQLQRQLIDICDRNNIYVLSDEVYRLLEHNPKDRLPAMAELYDKGISACTMSKPWGGCGVTIGWLVLQNMELKQKLIDTQYFGTTCPSRASEIQAMMILRASDSIIASRLAIIRKNLSLLDDFFREHGDFFEWNRPSAGAIGYVRFKGPLSADKLAEQLAAARISVKPAPLFGAQSDLYQDYFRIGFGERSMPQALSALSRFVIKKRPDWQTGVE
ncbi:MAG: pyridoxal phosphate-dependent aminotransferase [Porticoccaceae bacterium]|nr:pyridoxal phosphate-dependent aminotransferase [Porticoccaceae bacterium]MDG1307026.1 pyridoxal phosphate-dependent aminotransferase [Porticoccaceae bacterium]